MATTLKQFDEICSKLRQSRRLFEDPDFRATSESIFYSRQMKGFEWQRPIDICRSNRLSQPELFQEGGAERFDIVQGELGDCWVVASMAALADHPTLMRRVIPPDQGFQHHNYCGAFLFNFWRFGQWRSVMIDDRLPVRNGKLVFIHSRNENEFWGALLEKALAKLYGSYEALKYGMLADSLTDFTGGLTETYLLRGPNRNWPKNIVNVMFKALERESLIGCSIHSVKGSSGETKLPNGLVAGHAYTVTDLREIRLITSEGDKPFILIRVRNPWGSRIEWNGAWSDRSDEWNQIPNENKREMGLVFRSDGEFWMEFEDFLANFDTLDICNLTPDIALQTPRRWKCEMYTDKWQRGITAGGRPQQRTTHWINPQFRLTLNENDDDEDECSCVIEVMQDDRRVVKSGGPNYRNIGFALYQIPPEFVKSSAPLPEEFFRTNRHIGAVDFFANIRQISKRFLLPRGHYCVIPCTYEPNVDAFFILRIFFEKSVNESRVAVTNLAMNPTTAIANEIEVRLDDKVKQMFFDASGQDMRISVFDLQNFLNSTMRFERENYSLQSAKALLFLIDEDQSFDLEYIEFVRLIQLVTAWTNTYRSQCRPGASLPSFALDAVVRQLGYRLPSGVIRFMQLQSMDEKNNISFDSFVQVVAKLRHIHNTYQRSLPQQSRGNVDTTLPPMDLESFLKATIALKTFPSFYLRFYSFSSYMFFSHLSHYAHFSQFYSSHFFQL